MLLLCTTCLQVFPICLHSISTSSPHLEALLTHSQTLFLFPLTHKSNLLLGQCLAFFVNKHWIFVNLDFGSICNPSDFHQGTALIVLCNLPSCCLPLWGIIKDKHWFYRHSNCVNVYARGGKKEETEIYDWVQLQDITTRNPNKIHFYDIQTTYKLGTWLSLVV